MANTVTGTCGNVTLLNEDLTAGVDNRYQAIVSASFTAADSSTPTTTSLLLVTTAIQNSRRDGKTVTLLGGVCAQPAVDSAGTKAYFTGTGNVAALTVSTSSLTGSLCAAAQTTLAAWTLASVRNALILVDYSLA